MTRPSATTETAASRWSRILFVLLVMLVGAALAIGGGILVTVGGSFYYVLTGLVLLVSAVLILRRDRRGVWLYGAMLVATVAWAVWEAGFAPWALVPRLVAPFVLGLGLLFPWVRGVDRHAPVLRSGRGWPVFGAGVLAAVVLGAGLGAVGPGRPEDPLWQTGAPIGRPPGWRAPWRPWRRPTGKPSATTRVAPASARRRRSPRRMSGVWKRCGKPRPAPQCRAPRAGWR